MDKNTLSQYGWVVIVIIVLLILIALATPFGSYIAKAAIKSTQAMNNHVTKIFDKNNIKYNPPYMDTDTPALRNPSPTDYTSAEISTNNKLYAVGETNPDFVVIRISDDGKTAYVTKNGSSSDGKIDPYFDIGQFEDITTVLYGEGLVNTGYTAGCFPNVSSVELPHGLTEISDLAFMETPNLKTVEIPNTVTYIGDSAFLRSSIEHIIMPDSVTTLGNCAFETCTKLRSIVISKNVTNLGVSFLFTNSNSAPLEYVNVPDGVTNLGEYAFDERSNITVRIPESCTSFGSLGAGTNITIICKKGSPADIYFTTWNQNQSHDSVRVTIKYE